MIVPFTSHLDVPCGVTSTLLWTAFEMMINSWPTWWYNSCIFTTWQCIVTHISQSTRVRSRYFCKIFRCKMIFALQIEWGLLLFWTPELYRPLCDSLASIVSRTISRALKHRIIPSLFRFLCQFRYQDESHCRNMYHRTSLTYKCVMLNFILDTSPLTFWRIAYGHTGALGQEQNQESLPSHRAASSIAGEISCLSVHLCVQKPKVLTKILTWNIYWNVDSNKIYDNTIANNICMDQTISVEVLTAIISLWTLTTSTQLIPKQHQHGPKQHLLEYRPKRCPHGLQQCLVQDFLIQHSLFDRPKQ